MAFFFLDRIPPPRGEGYKPRVFWSESEELRTLLDGSKGGFCYVPKSLGGIGRRIVRGVLLFVPWKRPRPISATPDRAPNPKGSPFSAGKRLPGASKPKSKRISLEGYKCWCATLEKKSFAVWRRPARARMADTKFARHRAPSYRTVSPRPLGGSNAKIAGWLRVLNQRESNLKSSAVPIPTTLERGGRGAFRPAQIGWGFLLGRVAWIVTACCLLVKKTQFPLVVLQAYPGLVRLGSAVR